MITLMTRRAAAAAVVSFVLAGCATVNTFVPLRPDYSDLPLDALRATAAEVERAVAAGEREAALPQYGINLDTPEIRQALRERAIRAPLVHAFLETGHAYEQRGGLLSILRTKEYKKSGTSSERDRNAQIVISENAARWTLYEGLLKANNFSRKNLSAVQEIFAEARVNELPPGAAYEAADGSIVRK
jgi:hypothetical protein